jgi:Sulfotransferase domain
MGLAPSIKRVGETIFGLVPERPRIGLRRLVRQQRERRKLALADLVVIAHPKSGSTWLRFQLARAYQRKYQLPLSVIPRIEIFHDLNPAIPRLHMAGYEYVKHVVARPAPGPELAAKQVIFLIRHPLDVIVSLYFHIQKHALRERKLFNNWPLSLDGVSMMQFASSVDWGLSEAISFYNSCARHAAALDRVHFVKYEDMRHNPGEVLYGLLQFAEAPFTRHEAIEAADFTSFDKLRAAEVKNTFNSTALRPGDPRDPDSFKVRRAKVHGYRDYFSPAEVERLESVVDERLDPSLGYSQRLQRQGEKNYELS